MEKYFIVAVDSFESKVVVDVLERNNKNYAWFIDRHGVLDDFAIKEIKENKGYEEIILVNFKPENMEEWDNFMDGDPYRIVAYENKENKKDEETLIEKVKNIIEEDILTGFQEIVSLGARDYIPGMSLMARELGYSEKQKEKVIKNILKGKALYRGVSKKAWADAEKAAKNQKWREIRGVHFIAVDYDYDDYTPVVDLVSGQYHDLLIQNKKDGRGVFFTVDSELVELVQQVVDGDCWTSRPEKKGRRYRILLDTLEGVEETIIRYLHTRRH